MVAIIQNLIKFSQEKKKILLHGKKSIGKKFIEKNSPRRSIEYNRSISFNDEKNTMQKLQKISRNTRDLINLRLLNVYSKCFHWSVLHF